MSGEKKRKLREDLDNLFKDLDSYESENRNLKRKVRRSEQLQHETDRLKVQVAQLQESLRQTESKLKSEQTEAQRLLAETRGSLAEAKVEADKIKSQLKAELDAKTNLIKELAFMKNNFPPWLREAAEAEARKARSVFETRAGEPEPNEASKTGAGVPEPNEASETGDIKVEKADDVSEVEESSEDDPDFEPEDDSDPDYEPETRNVIATPQQQEQLPQQLQPVVSTTQIFLPGPDGSVTRQEGRTDPIFDIYLKNTPRDKQCQPVRHLFQIFAAEKQKGIHQRPNWQPRDQRERESMVFILNHLNKRKHCYPSLSCDWNNSKGWDELVQALKPHEQKFLGILRGIQWTSSTVNQSLKFVLDSERREAEERRAQSEVPNPRQSQENSQRMN